MRKETLTQGILSSTFFKIASKILGVSRQALIASWFGLSQDLDFIDVCTGLLLISISLMGEVFELVFTPKVIEVFRESPAAAAQMVRQVILRFFILSASILSLLLWGRELILPLIASGYTSAQYDRITELLYYFIPGSLAALPFVALAGTSRALRMFSLSFIGEFIISLCMLLALFLPFEGAIAIPVSYSVGQIGGCLFLLIALRGFLLSKSSPTAPKRFNLSGHFWRGIRNITFINGAHVIFIFAEKNYGSHMPIGTLAAFSYAGLLFSAASSLPGFAGIYFTSLCENLSRDRLNHLISSTLLYASVTVSFLYFAALPLLGFFFQRGQMDQRGIEAAAMLLQIMALRMLTELPYQLIYRTYFILNNPLFPTISRYAINMISAVVAYCMLVHEVGPIGLAVHFLLQGSLMLIVDGYGLRKHGLAVKLSTILRGILCTTYFFTIAHISRSVTLALHFSFLNALIFFSTILGSAFLMLLYCCQRDPLIGSVYRKVLLLIGRVFKCGTQRTLS